MTLFSMVAESERYGSGGVLIEKQTHSSKNIEVSILHLFLDPRVYPSMEVKNPS